MYARLEAEPLSVPCAGPFATAKVRGLPSPEEPPSTTPTGASSLVVTCCGLATTGAATAPYPVSVAGAEVCVEDEPIEAVTVVA